MKKPGEGARACLWVQSTDDQSFANSLRHVQQRAVI